MNRKSRGFDDASPFLNEKTRHSHKRLSDNIIKLHQDVNSTQELLATDCSAYAQNHTHICKICKKKTHTKREIGDSCKQKRTEKTRDFYDVRPFLNEKTRHSHKRISANPVKMHSKVTSLSGNPVKMHTKNPTTPLKQGAV